MEHHDSQLALIPGEGPRDVPLTEKGALLTGKIESLSRRIPSPAPRIVRVFRCFPASCR